MVETTIATCFYSYCSYIFGNFLFDLENVYIDHLPFKYPNVLYTTLPFKVKNQAGVRIFSVAGVKSKAFEKRSLISKSMHKKSRFRVRDLS